MARNAVAVAVLFIGVFLVLYGLGLVAPPPGGGGGGTTTATLQKGTLIVKAKDISGNIFDAGIFIDGQLSGRGSVTLQVEPYREYTVSFEERTGYYTPPPQTVELWPGQRVELVATYYLKSPEVTTYLLTVYVQECNVANACFPFPNMDVRLDDGQSGRTGSDGRITFRVVAGQRTITVTLANGVTQTKQVIVDRDMETTVTIRTSGLTTIPTPPADLIALAVFIAVIALALLWRRR